MSFHHHHSHHHHRQGYQNSPPCCNPNSIYTSNCCCSSSYSSPSPQQAQTDSNQQQQLLQTLTSLLLFQTQTQTQTQKPHPPVYSKPSNPTSNLYRPNNDNHASLLHSLLRRVSLLESSLSYQRDPAPPVSHSLPKRRSVRHLAAATIQRYFRSFLVRRSRTLRDLKELAVVKSSVAGLRACLSDRSVRNPRAVLKEVEELMFKLDCIQSSDVMIREGKRTIRKELIRVSDFVEKVLLREQKDEAAELEKRRDRVRRVSFEENGNEDNFFDDMSERTSEEETQMRNMGFCSQSSDSDESPRVRHGLAAPVPVTMESRRNGCTKKVATEGD